MMSVRMSFCLSVVTAWLARNRVPPCAAYQSGRGAADPALAGVPRVPDRSVLAVAEPTARAPYGSAHCDPTTTLSRWNLRVGHRGGQVGGRSLVGEADHRAVDVHSCGAVGSRLAGGRVHPRQQVRPGGRQVQDLDLVDLPP